MGHKVLLADDSITVQKIVKLSLTEEGVEVIAVGNGEQAVQQLETLRPDLVMADVFMPGKDGYEVCEFVKSHPQLKQTPVILLVHAFEPFDPERAQKVGADHQLTKPFQSIRTLVTTVCDLLQASAGSKTIHTEPMATAASPTATVTPFPSQSSKSPEEEFAVVSSLTPATSDSIEPSAEIVTMPSFAATSVPEVLTPSTSVLMAEASLPLPLPSTSSLSHEDLLPPSELSVLSQPGWQPTPPSQTGWQAAAPLLADESATVSNPEVLAPAFSSLAPTVATPVADDVLELSDVLSAPFPMAPVAPLASHLAPEDVPLLAVLSASATDSQDVQPTNPLAEPVTPIFAGSFDLGTGHLSPQSELPSDDQVNRMQDVNLGAVTQPAPTADFPISEAVIEEIVNRVIQRLSTNAIQEIAWEVVPEMAELLIRKQISQQKHLAH